MFFLCSSGRGAQSAAWDGQSGYRIHVSDLAAGVKRKEIEQAFSKYGTINEVCFLFVYITFSFFSLLDMGSNKSALFRFY